MKIDQVMLGNMSSSMELGNYAVAAKLSEIWYFVPTAICSSLFPSIIRTRQRSKVAYYDRLQKLIRRYGLVRSYSSYFHHLLCLATLSKLCSGLNIQRQATF